MTVTASPRLGGSGARASRPGPARAETVEQLSRADRVARGKDARAVAPLESHAEFTPGGSRDPVGLLLEQAKSRVPELVPVRHGRMLVSAFTFYRGAALPMAADLASTPASGLRVQLCGDAHLSNFGAFASPERRLVFDVNDFDETLPGPFEWDVKRLAASLAVAGRDNGFPAKARRKITLAAAEGYRTAMRAFADQPLLEVWYAHLDIEQAIGEFQSQIKAKRFKASREAAGQGAHRRQHEGAAQADHRGRRAAADHQRPADDRPDRGGLRRRAGRRDLRARSARCWASTGGPCSPTGGTCWSSSRLVQVARKVVGVGSVGTRAWILLMDAGDGTEPLFLQAKEAQPSVLADYCGRSQYTNQGERVVAGQHLMQAESDIFLGWTRAPGPDKVDRDFYVRQLKDWKFSFPIEAMIPSGMTAYAQLCGWTLARAHARSGDRVALAAYLGGSDRFDQAIADFAETYADQNERDYAALQAAVKEGKVEATTEI